MANQDPQPLQWALPPDLEVPPDELKLRLDFYSQAIMMHVVDKGVIQGRMVSAEDISRVLARQIGVFSGLLPRDTIWWRQRAEGVEVAIWRRPQVTRIAFQEAMFQPATRLTLPMPGLLFLCSPGRPPWLWAMKKRPSTPEDILYAAPCYNVFASGQSCEGTHKYSQAVGEIPEEFFTAFFSPAGDQHRRSQQYPDDLRKLWRELDGKSRFPLSDLVEVGRLGQIIGDLRQH